MKVKFEKPVAKFTKDFYKINEVADIDDDRAKILILKGHAIEVKEEKEEKETKEHKPKRKTK